MNFDMPKRVKLLAEIFEEAAKANSITDKVKILRENDSESLRYLLELGFHPNVGWWIPEGSPPYKPCDLIDLEGRLYAESRTLYLYLSGNRPDMKQMQREHLYIGLLESVHPKDAELLIAIKDKKVPGLSVTIINEAFPGLIPNE